MASEERRFIHGVPVMFPCKPYPSQFSMMEKVIKGIERRQNCLLESPTGSGKSLALLCSALAWQTTEYEKKAKEELEGMTNEKESCTCSCKQEDEKVPCEENNKEMSPVPAKSSSSSGMIVIGDDDDDFQDPSKKTPSIIKPKRKHQSISYETSPPGSQKDHSDTTPPGKSKLDEEGSGGCCACDKTDKKAVRKVPKIYFGTRTHKQITQIIRELNKTAYREVSMTILGSRKHTCIHPVVSKMSNKNEGCKELMDGSGCRYNDRIKKTLANQEMVRERGLTQAWDLEDLIEVCREHEACSYFGSRGLMKDSDIIFCPYNYLIDPSIREALDINIKNQVIILDEAHNIEDSSREAASETITNDQLVKATEDLDVMIKNQIKLPDHLRIRQMCSGLIDLIADNDGKLDQSDFDRAYTCWSGFDIVARFDQRGIGPKHYEELFKSFQKITDTEEDPVVRDNFGNIVKLPQVVLNTLGALFQVLRYMYSNDLKFVPDYRFAIVKATSYRTNTDTNDKVLNSRKKRGGQRNVPVQVFSLNFWCMNPGVAFSDFNVCRNVVLTSGTLSPMSSFESELGVPFPIKLEASHVIEDKQVWVGAMSKGPRDRSLHCVYRNMETFDFQDEMGETVLKICQKVPHGVLCFMPSYKALDKFRDRWQRTQIWDKIERKKKIICEPRASENVDFEELIKDFYELIEEYSNMDVDLSGEVDGVLFIAVCRGKVSEGLDFTDNNARAVITVGIPYPNFKDIQVKLKREYNDKYRLSRGLLSGSDWYEIQAFRALNQALGRCIRHRKDWGALVLADERFVKNGAKYCKGLSKWVRNKVKPFEGFYTALDSLATFTQDRLKDMPKINPDTSFIPCTPVTPGRFCVPSPIATSSKKVTPSSSDSKPKTTKKVTPAKPIPYHMDSPTVNPPSTPGMSASVFSSPPPNSSANLEKRKAYSLLSPTEVKNNKQLSALAQNQHIIQSGNQQLQIVNQKPQQPVTQGASFDQILSVINSSVAPKNKPYYIMLNQGTPKQQMFLIEPPTTPTTAQNIKVPTSQNAGVSGLHGNVNQTMGMTGNIVQPVANTPGKPPITQQVVSSASGSVKQPISQQVGVATTPGNVKTAAAPVKDLLDNKTPVQCKTENREGGKLKSGVNKLLKFCKLPEKATPQKLEIKQENTDQMKDDTMETSRCISPNLFDIDSQDNEVQTESEVLPKEKDEENCGRKTELKAENASSATKRRPIFKQRRTAHTEENMMQCSDASEEDFKESKQSTTKPADNDENNDQMDNEDQELRTRRKTRGVKRKSLSRNLANKKSKGIDFLNEIDDTDENASPSVVTCKECGKILIPLLKAYERRKRLPPFMNDISSSKNSRSADTIYIENCSSTKTLSSLQTNDKGVTLNCALDDKSECVVQFLVCVFCSKNKQSPVLGAKVIVAPPTHKHYKAGQVWLLPTAVNIEKK